MTMELCGDVATISGESISAALTLEEMKNIDVRLVDPNTLADYTSVQVNTSLPKDEQIMDYFKQIKNPYCFKVGKAVVKISHADNEASTEDCLERYLLSL